MVLDQHDLKVIDQSKNELRALFARWSGGVKCKVFANFGLEGRVGSVLGVGVELDKTQLNSKLKSEDFLNSTQPEI